MRNLSSNNILHVDPYIPGGNAPLYDTAQWIKLASNENCLGPSEKIFGSARYILEKCHIYPSSERELLAFYIAQYLEKYKIKSEQISIGNGSSELIVNLVRGLLNIDEAIIIGKPSFIMYEIAAQTHGREIIAIQNSSDLSYDLDTILHACLKKTRPFPKMIFLANPNNPTSLYIKKHDLLSFITKIPMETVLVIDEAYGEYVWHDDYYSALNIVNERARTVVLKTFSKAFGIAGMRVGYAVGDKEIINILNKVRDPFNVNLPGLLAAKISLLDIEKLKESFIYNKNAISKLKIALEDLGFFVYPSAANFLLVKNNFSHITIDQIHSELLKKRIIIRPLKNYNLLDHMRITTGLFEQQEALIEALKRIIK